MRNIMMTATIAGIFLIAGCNDSTAPVSSTRPGASTQQRLKQDVNAAGQDLKNAGDEMARKADPVIERAKEDSKEALHQAAEKVSQLTAPTQPAPATQP